MGNYRAERGRATEGAVVSAPDVDLVGLGMTPMSLTPGATPLLLAAEASAAALADAGIERVRRRRAARRLVAGRAAGPAGRRLRQPGWLLGSAPPGARRDQGRDDHRHDPARAPRDHRRGGDHRAVRIRRRPAGRRSGFRLDVRAERRQHRRARTRARLGTTRVGADLRTARPAVAARHRYRRRRTARRWPPPHGVGRAAIPMRSTANRSTTTATTPAR